jgi:hypothetical protein
MAGAVVNQVVLIALGLWSIRSLMIPVIVVVIGFAYLPRMR